MPGSDETGDGHQHVWLHRSQRWVRNRDSKTKSNHPSPCRSFGGNPASCLIQLRLRFESRERIAKNLEIPRTVRVREVGSNDQDLKARLVDKGLAHESPVVLAHVILETAHG